MAELDFADLNDGLDVSEVDRGVTAGVDKPPGGGNFVFGFNSLVAAAGAVAKKVSPQTGSNFDPLLKGGSIRGVVKRGASPGPIGWAPFLFIGHQGPNPGSVVDLSYMLGIEDAEPFRIVLRKATLDSGIPLADESNSLWRSSDTTGLAEDKFFHLRLDMVVNLNGDVVLKVFENDLTQQPLGVAPVWQAIGGMADFIDDALGINTGSQPFVSGRMGFGCQFSDASRRAYFDHAEALKQL